MGSEDTGGRDVIYVWGSDVVGVEAAAAAHLEGVAVRRVDLRDGLDALAHATRSGGLFGPVGVWADGATALRAADAKALAAACPEGVRVALLAERAAPTWLQRCLDGRVTVVDRSVPKGNGFANWVRNTGRSLGVTVDRDGAEVIAAATGGDPGRARSVLWVCAATGVSAPSVAQVERIVGGWSSQTHAFTAVDAALEGNLAAALTAVEGIPSPIVAAALRTTAKRAISLEAGDEVPRFARRALSSAARRGVDAAALARHTVAVELASRGHGDDTGTVTAALAQIAAGQP